MSVPLSPDALELSGVVANMIDDTRSEQYQFLARLAASAFVVALVLAFVGTL